MLHWSASRFAPAREIGVEPPLTPVSPRRACGVFSRRAEHARMLEHAANRRRRAAGSDTPDYWRACAPAAVARAARLRTEVDFPRLP